MTAIAGSRLGSTLETAIIIIAEIPEEGLTIEQIFLRQLFGDLQEFVSQMLINHNGRMYDRVTVLIGGRRENVYFDISSFHPVRTSSVAPRPFVPPTA